MLVSQQHFQERYPGCSAGLQNLPWATLFPQYPQGSRDSPAQGRIGGCQVHGTPCHGDGPMGAEHTAGCTLVWGRTHGCHVYGWVTLVWSKTHRCHASGRVHPGKGLDPRVPHAWQGDLGMGKEPQVPSAWQGAPSSGAGPMGARHIVGCTPVWDSTHRCQGHGRVHPTMGQHPWVPGTWQGHPSTGPCARRQVQMERAGACVGRRGKRAGGGERRSLDVDYSSAASVACHLFPAAGGSSPTGLPRPRSCCHIWVPPELAVHMGARCPCCPTG